MAIEKIIQNPTKKVEYDAFIAYVESGMPPAMWTEYVVGMGVSRETLTDWKKTELFVAARKKVIGAALEGMKRSGADDWRMHRELMKMNGIDPVMQVDVTSNGETIGLTGLLQALEGKSKGLESLTVNENAS